ncbi:MAG: cryptochrome DASH, partial [Pseudanabaena sp. RU_4_16]|nr:cryptochrome DASH [Pseudanabaena sp. RU_4_16]
MWYRNDLRLQDHQPLSEALKLSTQIIPIYCFDPRQFGKTVFGFPKTGAFRAQFLQESVADLRQSWRSLSLDLILRYGYPEEIIPQLALELG